MNLQTYKLKNHVYIFFRSELGMIRCDKCDNLEVFTIVTPCHTFDN